MSTKGAPLKFWTDDFITRWLGTCESPPHHLANCDFPRISPPFSSSIRSCYSLRIASVWINIRCIEAQISMSDLLQANASDQRQTNCTADCKHLDSLRDGRALGILGRPGFIGGPLYVSLFLLSSEHSYNVPNTRGWTSSSETRLAVHIRRVSLPRTNDSSLPVCTILFTLLCPHPNHYVFLPFYINISAPAERWIKFFVDLSNTARGTSLYEKRNSQCRDFTVK